MTKKRKLNRRKAWAVFHNRRIARIFGILEIYPNKPKYPRPREDYRPVEIRELPKEPKS